MLPLFMRSVKFLVGLAFIGVLMLAFLFTAIGYFQDPPRPTVEHEFHLHPKELKLASDGPLGKFDQRQLQRGLQVYTEVCSACHSLGLVSFRELKALGYNDAQVKKYAKDFGAHAKQPTFDAKTGDRGERDNLASDRFPHIPYAGNGTPPDLSLIAKARHGGGAYVYSLLPRVVKQRADKKKNKEGETKAPPD